ncbi:MAG: release factor glutamine methyltransferase [Gemmatales bacterium]|nr:MAG: release factor glutamine methyltransferase [Gemmatales bacterium]
MNMSTDSQNPATRAWTIGSLLDWTASFLAQRGAESPRLDAEVLLAYVLRCRRIDLYTRFTEPAQQATCEQYRGLIQRRMEGCPVAYLVGKKEFYGLELEVNASVLIPRPDSEFVVMECLRLAKDIAEPHILDLGTGSGNLAIAIAKNHRGARITAVDISPQAIEVARRNAERHRVSERLAFLTGDLFEPLDRGRRFDFIVSNPPYIPRGEIKNLEPGVRDFEPHAALDGGPTGFEVLTRIAAHARSFLVEGGYVIVEIGAPQEKGARACFAQHPEYRLAETIYDYSRHPRVLCARFIK